MHGDKSDWKENKVGMLYRRNVKEIVIANLNTFVSAQEHRIFRMYAIVPCIEEMSAPFSRLERNGCNCLMGV